MNLEFVAIEYWVGVRPVKMGPALGHFRYGSQETFFHRYGPGRMTFGSMKYNVLKEYGSISTDDDVALDAVAIRFARDFPLVPMMKPRAGWLSPTGKYYPCGESQHLGTAALLAQEIGEVDGGERFLELQGWIKTYDDLVSATHLKRGPTQRQLDVLFELSQLSNAKAEFSSAIMEFLRRCQS